MASSSLPTPPTPHSLARPAIPQLDGLVEGGTGDHTGVWGEEHLVDEGLVSRHPCKGLLVLCWGPQEQGEVVRARHQPLWALALGEAENTHSVGYGLGRENPALAANTLITQHQR